MTDAELLQMYRDAEERHRATVEAEAYARGRRDALREVLERLQAAAQPQPAPEPAEE